MSQGDKKNHVKSCLNWSTFFLRTKQNRKKSYLKGNFNTNKEQERYIKYNISC